MSLFSMLTTITSTCSNHENITSASEITIDKNSLKMLIHFFYHYRPVALFKLQP